MVVPQEVKNIIDELKKAGHEAYVVGGCVRDFLRGVEPQDWDITTGAKPEEIRKVFPDSFYENKFLTVTVITGSENPKLKEIEITTFRSEAKYSDKRHPDEIRFAKTLEEDLARRDFTINSIALEFPIPNSQFPKVIDIFDGQDDLKNKIIRTVGNPDDRFSEDALRMLRAVRFSAVLGFKIESRAAEAIVRNGKWLEKVSKERIRDEFVKIIMSDNAADGVDLLMELGLLKFVVSELIENVGVGQNKHHIYDCYQHALKALEYAAKKKFNLQVRLAALFHDIAKPRVKAGDGPDSTFYNHEVVGAKMTREILNRLKFSKKDIEKITKLVRFHLFYYNVDEVTESSVRRLVRNVGAENMEELLQVRQADRIGSGVPKAEPYKLRHLKYVIEKAAQDPISAKMLAVGGEDVMNVLKIKPGPKIGQILDILLGYVLEDPQKNKKDFLEKEIGNLGKLDDAELKKLAEKSKAEKGRVETKRDEMTKKKYWIT